MKHLLLIAIFLSQKAFASPLECSPFRDKSTNTTMDCTDYDSKWLKVESGSKDEVKYVLRNSALAEVIYANLTYDITPLTVAVYGGPGPGARWVDSQHDSLDTSEYLPASYYYFCSKHLHSKYHVDHEIARDIYYTCSIGHWRLDDRAISKRTN